MSFHAVPATHTRTLVPSMHFSCSHEIGSGYGGPEVRCSHGWRVTSPLGTPRGYLERRLRRMHTHTSTHMHTHTNTHAHTRTRHTHTHTHFASHSPLTPSRVRTFADPQVKVGARQGEAKLPHLPLRVQPLEPKVCDLPLAHAKTQMRLCPSSVCLAGWLTG